MENTENMIDFNTGNISQQLHSRQEKKSTESRKFTKLDLLNSNI